jgi:hypothetical protein
MVAFLEEAVPFRTQILMQDIFDVFALRTYVGNTAEPFGFLKNLNLDGVSVFCVGLFLVV